MLIDCGRCRFDLEAMLDVIDEGLYSLADLFEMSPAFLAHHPYVIRRLDPQWNVFDTHDARTKLIHYTNTTRISLRSLGSVLTIPLASCGSDTSARRWPPASSRALTSSWPWSARTPGVTSSAGTLRASGGCSGPRGGSAARPAGRRSG
jgi:hypothetical protein